MELDNILAKYSRKEDRLLKILLDYQNTINTSYISEEKLVEIANHLGITTSKVCSVMSFYTLLSSTPRGKYIIQVCQDVSCFISDDVNVLKTVEDELHIKVNETTKDKQFTLEFTSCIGCCNESPAMRIHNQTYTCLTKEKIMDALTEWGCK